MVQLGTGFIYLPIAKGQKVRIKKVFFEEKYQKCKLTFEDINGATHTEHFSFLTNNNKPNDVALNLFTTIAMCAFNDFKMAHKEFDPHDLVGKYLILDTYEQEDKNNEGKFYTNTTNYKVLKDEDNPWLTGEVEEDEEVEEDADIVEDDDDDDLFD